MRGGASARLPRPGNPTAPPGPGPAVPSRRVRTYPRYARISANAGRRRDGAFAEIRGIRGFLRTHRGGSFNNHLLVRSSVPSGENAWQVIFASVSDAAIGVESTVYAYAICAGATPVAP